jgi:hypothetical protein
MYLKNRLDSHWRKMPPHWVLEYGTDRKLRQRLRSQSSSSAPCSAFLGHQKKLAPRAQPSSRLTSSPHLIFHSALSPPSHTNRTAIFQSILIVHAHPNPSSPLDRSHIVVIMVRTPSTFLSPRLSFGRQPRRHGYRPSVDEAETRRLRWPLWIKSLDARKAQETQSG